MTWHKVYWCMFLSLKKFYKLSKKTLIFRCGSGWHRQETAFYLILLFEAVALPRLHLVDVLEQVGHSDGRVELPRVVGGALASALVPRGASEQTAGFVHRTTSVTWTNTKNMYRFREDKKFKSWQAAIQDSLTPVTAVCSFEAAVTGFTCVGIAWCLHHRDVRCTWFVCQERFLLDVTAISIFYNLGFSF